MRITPLYEQGADNVRIGQYVRDWLKWVRSGIGGLAKMKEKEVIKQRLHPTVYVGYRRLYSEAILVNEYLSFYQLLSFYV